MSTLYCVGFRYSVHLLLDRPSYCLQVTAFIAVPAMLEDLIGDTDAAASDPISMCVRSILVGAAPLSRRLATACQGCFPTARIVAAYGMTEACSSICFRKMDPSSLDRDDQYASCSALPGTDSSQCVGLPAPGIDVSIDARTGAFAATEISCLPIVLAGMRDGWSMTGAEEICVRGPNTLVRYCGAVWQPEPGGWFRTGDLGDAQPS